MTEPINGGVLGGVLAAIEERILRALAEGLALSRREPLCIKESCCEVSP